MNKSDSSTPPRWATRFLEWYCRPSLLEDLQGDLQEYFERNRKKIGLHRARIIYVIDVLKFLRLYTIRKPELINLLIHWLMLHSYVKTSTRNIVRNKLFSTINVIGLAISMSVGLLMIAFLSDLLSYDKFHSRGSRIYRISEMFSGGGAEDNLLASTSVRAGKLIKKNVSGIESAVILRRGFGGDARSGNTVVPVSGLWADEEFFNVFSFELIEGDEVTSLKEPYSIVLTESAGKKLFGSSAAVGKSVKIDTLNYTVTGVVKDPPKFSHIRFEVLASFATKEKLEQASASFLSWESIWMNYVYIVAEAGASTEAIQSSLDKICETENRTARNFKTSLFLQPLHDIALGADMSNQIGPTMDISIVYFVGALALVVLLSACFNYTNLSLARSFNRAREVGIRKVIGALKGHVLFQFIVEAIMISFFALIIAAGLFMLIKPQFLKINPHLGEIVSLDIGWKAMLGFLFLAISVGFFAGLVPSLFFARLNAAHVLKDSSTIKVFRNISFRKALIVVQYTLSLGFITATLIAAKQYKFFITTDLGFNTENIVNIDLQGNGAQNIENDLRQIPEVQLISRSLMVTTIGDSWGSSMKYKDPMDSASVFYNSVDEHYQPLHGHALVAGRNFFAEPNANQSKVLVNEKLLKRFSIANGDPSRALGEIINVDGKKLEIIGVLKDFHYGKLSQEITPVIFRYLKEEAGFLNVMLHAKDLPATMAKIEKIWKKHDTVHALEARFYDDQIEESYRDFSAMLKIVGFLAFLAITIASLGLLGMVVFTTESRLKEMSIRRVLGATPGNVIILLSRGFLMLLTVAALIALPLTYFIVDKMILSHIAYRIQIQFPELAGSVIIVLIIAAIMIASQSIKVARTNPAEILKGE